MLEAPEIVKIGDQEYKVSGFTQKIQDGFERYMQFHLLACLRENKLELADDYLSLLQKHFLDVKSGKMCFMSTVFLDFIQQDVHFAELLWYCFAACSDMVPKRTIEKWIADEPVESVELFKRLLESKKKHVESKSGVS